MGILITADTIVILRLRSIADDGVARTRARDMLALTKVGLLGLVTAVVWQLSGAAHSHLHTSI